jgi:DDB1- and CUL4-associated factor 7
MSPTAPQLSPRDFTAAPGPQIKLEQPASQPVTPSHYPAAQAQAHAQAQAQAPPNSSSSVPNVLQPAGGLGPARPPVLSTNTASSLATMSGSIQQSPSDYSSPSKPPTLSLSAHGYSRSSSANAPYDSPSTYTPYTPTTPGGTVTGPPQFMSTPDPKYGAPGSQRNISNTPLGLADIRPRADSSLSDGTPGTLGYELANAQPTTSNYLAPWALYAFDWCKWTPPGKGVGKVAIGSYLEDGHNFVSTRPRDNQEDGDDDDDDDAAATNVTVIHFQHCCVTCATRSNPLAAIDSNSRYPDR